MPRLFLFQGFAIFFWTAENGEPVHVHVAKGRPSPGATKIWLTRNGSCMLASNGSGLNRKELADVLDFVMLNHEEICGRWKECPTVTSPSIGRSGRSRVRVARVWVNVRQTAEPVGVTERAV